MPSAPPPPPPPPPPAGIDAFAGTLTPSAAAAAAASSSGHRGSSSSAGPTVLIIGGILVLVALASAAIHHLIRLFRRPSPPSPLPRQSSSSDRNQDSKPYLDPKTLIASLPLFSLSSFPAAAAAKTPLDCAVCLSSFAADDQLRLLPSCRHAFHQPCIDTWLLSTPSCPLCRSSVLMPSAPPLSALPSPSPRSGSFRLEIGSVSRRHVSFRSSSDDDGDPLPPPPPPHVRTYSLGSSFDYVVEDDVEAVVHLWPDSDSNSNSKGQDPAAEPGAPGADVAEAAGGAGRSWLKDYVDRLASSASSSFNSLRFSGRWSSQRWSQRFDGAAPADEGWDLEANGGGAVGEVESFFAEFHRWLAGL